MEKFLAYAVIAGLAWAPLWLGGDRTLPWGVNAVLFPTLAIAYEANILVSRRRHAFGIARILGPAILFLAPVGWTIVQISPDVFAGLAHPVWSLAADTLKADLPATISVNPGASALALMRLLTEASLFWLCLQLGRNAQRGLMLLRAIAFIVALYSACGLILAAVYGARIPFYEEAAPAASFVRATFVNRNSFATYAGLGLVVMVALLLRLYRHVVPDNSGALSFRIARLIEASGRQGLIWLAATLVTMVALLGTASRGGILAGAFGLLSIFLLSAARQRRRGAEQLETLTFVAVGLTAIFLLFGDSIVGRIQASGFGDASRLSVDRIVAGAIFDSPLLGFGYGDFVDIFPMYRDRSISPFGVWDMAHNSYLEIWLGLGLLFGTALMAAVAWLFFKCLRGAAKRRQNATAPIVATAASALVGLHALVDFSLQIDAVALTYAALLGLGVAQSESSAETISD